MRDLSYALAANGSMSESLVHLSLYPTNNSQALLPYHGIEAIIHITFLSELTPRPPKKGFRASKPSLEPPNHGKLPFFVTNYLEKGSDINYRETCIIDGSTALHQAMKYSGYTRVMILKLLLEKGIDVDIQDNLGNTALHLAVNSSRSLKELVTKLLLEHNININAQNQKGQTALHLASRRGHGAIVRELLRKKAEVDVRDNSGKTALHLATKYRYKSIVKVLLESRANINAQDIKGMTALHIASKLEDHAVMVRILLENGADVGIQDIHGRTVLHIVICRKDQARVELLLENGVDSGIPDRNGNTPRALDVHYHFETILFEAKRRKRTQTLQLPSPIR